MKQRLMLVLIVLMIGVAEPGITTAQSASLARTVFGQGAEIHLLPTYGPVGTRVSVVGLGYQPGVRVRILFGAPNAEFILQPIARAVVAPSGTFRTSFVITCAMTQFHRLPGSRCQATQQHLFQPLIIGGFVGQSFGNKRTSTTAFVVTPA